MKIDLVAFDLDGTTLTEDKRVSPATAGALKAAHKAGIKLVPCTGRGLSELPDDLNNLMDELGFDAFPYIISDNGAQVYDLPHKKQLFTTNLSEETGLAVLAAGRSCLALTYGGFGIESATDNGGRVWEAEEAKPFLTEFKKIWGFTLANLAELIKWNCGVVKMSMNFMLVDEWKKQYAEFSTWPGLNISSAWDRNIEFMSAGVNKGEALRFISEHSRIPLSNIMAAGDNHNDIEMIREAGWGVAMGNAVPELKEKAAWVTANNDEDGLAQAINKMLAERAASIPERV